MNNYCSSSHHNKQTDAFFNNNCSTSTMLYQCDLCDRAFTSGQALGGHKTSHRSSNNNLVLPQPITNKQRHLSVHNGILKFSWSYPYDDHDHDQDGKQKVAFGGSYDRFIQKGAIKSSSLSSPHHDDNLKKKHICHVCDKPFPSEKSLYGHMRIHKKDCNGIRPPQDTSFEHNDQEIDLLKCLPPKSYKTKKRGTRDIHIVDQECAFSPKDQECINAAEILMELSRDHGGDRHKRLKISSDTDAVDRDQETRCDVEIMKQVTNGNVVKDNNNEKKLVLRFKTQQPNNEEKNMDESETKKESRITMDFDLNELPTVDDVADQNNIN